MWRDQPVWLWKLGRKLREQGGRTAVPSQLPSAIQAALDRLAVSERQRDEHEQEQSEPRRRSG